MGKRKDSEKCWSLSILVRQDNALQYHSSCKSNHLTYKMTKLCMYDKLDTHYFEFKQKVKRIEGSLSTVQHDE